jgi:hypothetical protein
LPNAPSAPWIKKPVDDKHVVSPTGFEPVLPP